MYIFGENTSKKGADSEVASMNGLSSACYVFIFREGRRAPVAVIAEDPVK